jgi:hypothetical protein
MKGTTSAGDYYYSYGPHVDGRTLTRAVPLLFLACVCSSVLYSICLYRSPFLFLNPLLTVALGAAFAYFGRRVLRRSRTCGVGTIVGLATGILAVYISCLTFVYLRRGDEQGIGFLALLRPDVLWSQIESLWQIGWFSVQGHRITGLFAALHSAVEAGLIVGIPTIALRSGVDGFDPYCGVCKRAVDFKDRLIGIPADESVFVLLSDAEPVKRLARADWSDLESARPLVSAYRLAEGVAGDGATLHLAGARGVRDRRCADHPITLPSKPSSCRFWPEYGHISPSGYPQKLEESLFAQRAAPAGAERRAAASPQSPCQQRTLSEQEQPSKISHQSENGCCGIPN